MIKALLGVLLLGSAIAAQNRARYRVLDPFSANGVWSEVSPTSEAALNDAPLRQQSSLAEEKVIAPRSLAPEPPPSEQRAEETWDNEVGGDMALMERRAQVKRSELPREQPPRQKGEVVVEKAKAEEAKRDEQEVAEVMRARYRSNVPAPYLPDLTALKQAVSPDASTHATSPPARVQSATKSRDRSRKRRRRKPARSDNSFDEPHVAPALPRLPSLAAATNAPLPPQWNPLLRVHSSPMASSSMLEMDSTATQAASAAFSLDRSGADSADAFPPALDRRPFSGGRASWPSDVSPPADYFLPPEVLI